MDKSHPPSPRICCPYCRKNPAAEKPLWPFCSTRCKEGDLGAWAAGSYAIAGSSINENSELDISDEGSLAGDSNNGGNSED